MNHITDSQLNEYLDQVLDEALREQCDLHFASCADCRTRLEELNGLYADLAGLHEIELPQDLTASVLDRLPQPSIPLRTRTFAVQLGMALGVIMFILIEVSKAIHVPEFSSLRVTSPDLHSMLPYFSFPLITQPALIIPQLPTFQIPLTSLQVFVMVTCALLLGLVGNGILLCERPGARK